jgi:hypothetical protein
VAVAQYGCALEYASVELRADWEVVLTAVANDGPKYWAESPELGALRNASVELRADREVVLVAVAQCSCALQDASDELRADREVVLAAVTQDGHALMHASADMQTVHCVRPYQRLLLAVIESRGPGCTARPLLQSKAYCCRRTSARRRKS